MKIYRIAKRNLIPELISAIMAYKKHYKGISTEDAFEHFDSEGILGKGSFGQNATLEDLGDIEQSILAKWIMEDIRLEKIDQVMDRRFQLDPVQWAVSNSIIPEGYMRGQYRKSLKHLYEKEKPGKESKNENL